MAEGASVMAHVVAALILRETKTRFGRSPGGYLWALVEPVMFIGGFLALKEALGHSAARDGAAAVHFASGIITFFLFRGIVDRAMTAVAANRGLLMHPVVTPLDIVLARTLLEAATSLVVAGLIAAGILAIWGDGLPAAPLALLGVLGVTAGLGLALGLLFGGAATVWPVVERIVSPLLRLAFLISGVFFAPDALPAELRDLLLWNPVLHLTEAARDAWLAVPPERHGTLLYPIVIAWLLLPAGLAAERLARTRMAPA